MFLTGNTSYKRKNVKLDFNKVKNPSKETVKEMTRQITDWRTSIPHGPTELSGFIFSYICLFLVVLSYVDADVYVSSILRVTVGSIAPGLLCLELGCAGSWVKGAPSMLVHGVCSDCK